METTKGTQPGARRSQRSERRCVSPWRKGRGERPTGRDRGELRETACRKEHRCPQGTTSRASRGFWTKSLHPRLGVLPAHPSEVPHQSVIGWPCTKHRDMKPKCRETSNLNQVLHFRNKGRQRPTEV